METGFYLVFTSARSRRKKKKKKKQEDEKGNGSYPIQQFCYLRIDQWAVHENEFVSYR